MNLRELDESIAKLKPKLKHRSDSIFVEYDIDLRCLEGGIYITKAKDFWEIFHSERGNKNLIGKFETEDDACEYYFSCCKKIDGFRGVYDSRKNDY